MKIILILIALFYTSLSYAQINMKSAKTENGIVFSRDNGINTGYDFSTSEARFNYGRAQSQMIMYLLMKDGSKIKTTSDFDDSTIDKTQISDTVYVNPFKGSNFKLVVPITDGTNGIFSEGKFNPGVGLSYELIRNCDEFKTTSRYLFFRYGYELRQNKFGSINNLDSILIEKKLSHSLNVTPGINWLTSTANETDNLIIALSVAFQYGVNPVSDIKTKEFVIVDSTAANGTIQKTEKAYPKSQEDYFSITPKLDFAWTPFLQRNDDGEEIGLRIGLLSSISTKKNFNTNKMAWNFSIGPSIHPKWSTSNIIAALQVEFIDFNNSTGQKDFDDIFSVNFYVGIPLQLK